jgi:hypothetical protein
MATSAEAGRTEAYKSVVNRTVRDAIKDAARARTEGLGTGLNM